jgi:glycosyltransferase involved in cell wall biosynthesis
MNVSKLSVLEVIAAVSVNAGGTGMFMSDICHYLPDTSGEFSLLTVSRPGVKDLPIDDRVTVEKLGVRKDWFSKSLKPDQKETLAALTRLASSKSIGIVHLHGIWLDICRDTVSWARSNKMPLVVSPHGMLEPWALNHKKYKKQIAMALYQRRDLKSAHAFHACSQQEAENIRRLGLKQPIAVIPNGVQLPELGAQRSESRSQKKTALFLSRINPKKGLPMLLDAWKRLAPDDWRLVIAGNDDANHLPVVERKIRELGLQGRVEIVGSLFGAAKEQAFRSADLFVLPSYSENFGIVVTEALGYQLPVLTTKGCPWQELEVECCGWWVDPTPSGIEAGLAKALATNSDDLVAMGVRGRVLVECKYLWPSIAERMSEFYNWLLNGGNQPDFLV